MASENPDRNVHAKNSILPTLATRSEKISLGQKLRDVCRILNYGEEDEEANQTEDSPSQKQSKSEYFGHLSNEIEQWKLLKIKRENAKQVEGERAALLREEQRNYLERGINFNEWIEGSNKFRKKFEEYMQRKDFINSLNAKAESEALEILRQEAAKFTAENISIEKYPEENLKK